MFNIVLVEPEIPQNTGNIARTCAVTGSALHLVRPLGFEVSDRQLKRAGLDYWDKLEIYYYDSFAEVRERHPEGNFWYFSKKAGNCYAEVSYREGDFLVFGKETKGLPESLLLANRERSVRLPMVGDLRSLNLSNAVAVAVYEAWRQCGFSGGNRTGRLGKEAECPG